MQGRCLSQRIAERRGQTGVRQAAPLARDSQRGVRTCLVLLDALLGLSGALADVGRLLRGLLEVRGRFLAQLLGLFEDGLSLLLDRPGSVALPLAGREERSDEPAGSQGDHCVSHRVALSLARGPVGHASGRAGDP